MIDLAQLLKQSLGKGAGERKPPARGHAPATRGKTALRLVAGGAGTKRAAKPAARRKRA